MRKGNPVLKHGSLKHLVGEYGVIAYGRFDREDKFIVALNNTEETKTLYIPVWQIGCREEGVLENCLMTGRDGFSSFKFYYSVKDGMAVVTLPPKGAVVLKEV